VLVVLDLEGPREDGQVLTPAERKSRLPLLIAGAVVLIAVLVGIVTLLVLALQPQIQDLTPTPMNQLEQVITALPVPTELEDLVTSVVPLISTSLPAFPRPESTTPPPPGTSNSKGPFAAAGSGAEP
jgi:hypothetical protein